MGRVAKKPELDVYSGRMHKKKMEQKLSEKTALVTGASRGIGHAIAKALHQSGARVAITGRYEKTLRAAAKEIGPNCFALDCDHRNPASIQSLTDRFHNALGSLDILVNNAGVMLKKEVIGLSLQDWNDVIGTNLTGVFLTTKAFLPTMMHKTCADIVMISSMSGKKGDFGAAAYTASKFGLQGFSQSLLYEVRRHNIRVTVINPSAVDISEDVGPKDGPGLTLHANDIAATVVHIVSLPGRTLVRDIDIWGTNPY